MTDPPHLQILSSNIAEGTFSGVTLTWSIVDVGFTGRVNMDSPSLALDPVTGDPHIAFYESNLKQLKHAWRKTGTWNIETPDTSSDTGQGASIAVDNLHVHISYGSGSTATGIVRYIVKVKSTGIFSQRTFGNPGAVGTTSIALDSSGLPHIAYYDSTNGFLEFAEQTGAGIPPGGVWSTIVLVDGGSTGSFPSIALDQNGKPCFSYVDQSHGSLKYAKSTLSGYDIQTVDIVGDFGQGTFLAFDPNGTLT